MTPPCKRAPEGYEEMVIGAPPRQDAMHGEALQPPAPPPRLTFSNTRGGRETPLPSVRVMRCCPSAGVCLRMQRMSDRGIGWMAYMVRSLAVSTPPPPPPPPPLPGAPPAVPPFSGGSAPDAYGSQQRKRQLQRGAKMGAGRGPVGHCRPAGRRDCTQGVQACCPACPAPQPHALVLLYQGQSPQDALPPAGVHRHALLRGTGPG